VPIVNCTGQLRHSTLIHKLSEHYVLNHSEQSNIIPGGHSDPNHWEPFEAEDKGIIYPGGHSDPYHRVPFEAKESYYRNTLSRTLSSDMCIF
jgi:hypothetical protein